MIRLLLAGSQTIVRQGLINILSNTGSGISTRYADTSRAVMKTVMDHSVDVILLDFAIAEGNGYEIIRQVKQTDPKIKVLVLAAQIDRNHVLQAIKLGADGYVSKDIDMHDLFKAIHTVYVGCRYFNQSVIDEILNQVLNDNSESILDNLSCREFEVLDYLSRGVSVKEIAQRLALSPKTVTTYRSRLLKKLRLKNNAELIHYGIKMGLTDKQQ